MYKLIKVFNVKQEANEVKSAEYSVIYEFEHFEIDEETKDMLIAHCKENKLEYGSYTIVEYRNNEPIAVVGQLFYHSEDDELDSWMDMAEWNERVIASVALGYDLVLSEETKKKYGHTILKKTYIRNLAHILTFNKFAQIVKAEYQYKAQSASGEVKPIDTATMLESIESLEDNVIFADFVEWKYTNVSQVSDVEDFIVYGDLHDSIIGTVVTMHLSVEDGYTVEEVEDMLNKTLFNS